MQKGHAICSLFIHYSLKKKIDWKVYSWTEILLVEQNSYLCQSWDVIFHLVSQIAIRIVQTRWWWWWRRSSSNTCYELLTNGRNRVHCMNPHKLHHSWNGLRLNAIHMQQNSWYWSFLQLMLLFGFAFLLNILFRFPVKSLNY